MESIYLYLLRQIKGGDNSPPNTRLCDQLLRLLETHRSWLDSYPRLLMMAVYTYLRLIPEHRPMQLATLQQKEIRFVLAMLRQKASSQDKKVYLTCLILCCFSGIFVLEWVAISSVDFKMSIIYLILAPSGLISWIDLI